MRTTIKRDWFAKSVAGVVLGFGLGISLSGLFAWLSPGGIWVDGGKVIFVRILVEPIWMMVLGFCFLFKSGWQAWLWLGGANLVSFSALWACQYFLG